MLTDMSIKQSNKNMILVHPNYYSSEYPYRKATSPPNTYVFNRKEFGIDSNLTLRYVHYAIYNTLTTNNVWYFWNDLLTGKARESQTASSSGYIKDMVEIGVNGNQLGVSIDGDIITVTFYEASSSDLTQRYTDLILMFE